MTKLSLFKSLGLALGGAALVLTPNSISAADIRVNAGTTWTLTPTADPSVFTHTVNGVAQVSLLGNCTVHADVVVRFPPSSDQPPTLNGSFAFTTANGATTLKATVEGTGTPDPANPGFLNFHYHVTFAGGSGQFAAARGEADIDGVALFTAPSAGTATWTLKGFVITSPSGD